MSDALRVDVSVEMKDALKKLDKSKVEELLTASLVSGALLIANKAKELAPIRTGTLRRSIHVGGHTELTPDYGDGAGYEDLGEPGSLRAIVGTNLEYAPYQEYGTSRGVPAHPYMKPAMDTERDNVLKEIGAAFEELVTKQVGKL